MKNNIITGLFVGLNNNIDVSIIVLNQIIHSLLHKTILNDSGLQKNPIEAHNTKHCPVKRGASTVAYIIYSQHHGLYLKLTSLRRERMDIILDVQMALTSLKTASKVHCDVSLLPAKYQYIYIYMQWLSHCVKFTYIHYNHDTVCRHQNANSYNL